MTELERLSAIEELRQLKATYFRLADAKQWATMAALFTEDCVLDYSGSCRDPVTGTDVLPMLSEGPIHGRQAAIETFAKADVVTVHQGHMFEVEFTSDTTARGVWSMTDRLWPPAGAPISFMVGYGHYHETYERIDGSWKIKTLKLTRTRVEALAAN